MSEQPTIAFQPGVSAAYNLKNGFEDDAFTFV